MPCSEFDSRGACWTDPILVMAWVRQNGESSLINLVMSNRTAGLQHESEAAVVRAKVRIPARASDSISQTVSFTNLRKPTPPQNHLFIVYFH